MKRLPGALTLAGVLIAGAVLGSRLPIFGQAGRLAGTYKLTLTTPGGPLDVLATASSDGIIVGTPVPIADCLTGGYSLSSGYGSWNFGVGTVHFQVRSLLLHNGLSTGDFVTLIGTGNAASKAGHGTLQIPQVIQTCAYRGAFTFSSTPVPSE